MKVVDQRTENVKNSTTKFSNAIRGEAIYGLWFTCLAYHPKKSVKFEEIAMRCREVCVREIMFKEDAEMWSFLPFQ